MALADGPAAISYLGLARLGAGRPELLACDMRSGHVLALSPLTLPSPPGGEGRVRGGAAAPAWRSLGRVANPARAEVVDLDRDGIADVVVANLGHFTPTDSLFGGVELLRGGRDGKYVPVNLLSGVGRVADVRAADFDGDGDLDLVVAEYGWRKVGSIRWLENRTADWSRPHFVPHLVDERHGTIHVPVADLNGDGRPDFVALIAQEHEAIVAFINDGKGGFRKETVHEGPHPGYGSSGIELVDLDKDGDFDVLYTNGDALDEPHLLKPYHGVQWLENRGGFPFTHHHLAAMPGAHRALPCDLDGDGDLDVVVTGFLPVEAFPVATRADLPSVLVLEQTAPGKFVEHVVQAGEEGSVACAAGDLFGDGRAHFATATFSLGDDRPAPSTVTLWKNLGRRSRP